MPNLNARRLRKNPTDAEQKLWRHLRLRQMGEHKFRRQQPLGPYIVDFICFEKRMIIELDGSQHAEHSNYDAERTAWLEKQGFRVLRFWNNDVLTNIASAKEAIWKELESSPPPLPLPRKGGRVTNEY